MPLTDKQVQWIRRRAALRMGARPIYDLEEVFSPLPVTASKTEVKVRKDIQECIKRMLAGIPNPENYDLLAQPKNVYAHLTRPQPPPYTPNLKEEECKYYPDPKPVNNPEIPKRIREDKIFCNPNEFEKFGTGYINAICEWDDKGFYPHLDLQDIDETLWPTIRQDCATFFQQNFNLLKEWPTEWEQKGHDFWCIRDGYQDAFKIPPNAKHKKYYITKIGEDLVRAASAFGRWPLRLVKVNRKWMIVSALKTSNGTTT